MSSKQECLKIDDQRITAASEEYTFSLMYFVESDDQIRIWASRCPFSLAAKDSIITFYLAFEKDADTGGKYITWYHFDKELDQKEEERLLDPSTSLKELAAKHFRQIVYMWELELGKRLDANAGDKDLYKKAMMDLQGPRCNYAIGNPFAQSHSLNDTALVYGHADYVNMDWEQVPECEKYLYIPYISIKFERFMALKAARVNVRIGKITEEQIVQFLDTWKKGDPKFWPNFEWCVWRIARTQFNVAKLWSLLGRDIKECDVITSHQYNESRKLGRLYAVGGELRFFTETPSDQQAMSPPPKKRKRCT